MTLRICTVVMPCKLHDCEHFSTAIIPAYFDPVFFLSNYFTMKPEILYANSEQTTFFSWSRFCTMKSHDLSYPVKRDA